MDDGYGSILPVGLRAESGRRRDRTPGRLDLVSGYGSFARQYS